MKSGKFINNLSESFLKSDCDPSKSQYTKKIVSFVHKEDQNLVIFDNEYSINVVFESEVLQEALNNVKLKNVESITGHSVTITDSCVELISHTNAKNVVSNFLVLKVKQFEIAKGTEKNEVTTPRNINNDPKIFYLIQEFIHRQTKKSLRKQKTSILTPDEIASQTTNAKFESVRHIHEPKTSLNPQNFKKIDDSIVNQIHFRSIKTSEDGRNDDLERILKDNEEEDEGEEEPEKKENKKKVDYPAALQNLMEKYSNVLPSIKKGTILKFKSLKEQNEGN